LVTKWHKKINELNIHQQIKILGYWDFKEYPEFPGLYLIKKNNYLIFCGLIAHSRVISIFPKNIISLIMCGNHNYISLHTKGKFYFSPKSYMIKGICKIINEKTKEYSAIKFEFI